jgi:AraC family transcriptional regulator of adaptative response/methylated-DNA-[protein]-cysteine methyltransferase
MVLNKTSNYARIEKVIKFVQSHPKQQPSLEKIAAHVHLSPFHLQQVISEWAGVSLQKFMQFLTLEHSKTQLKKYKCNLNTMAYEIDLYRLGQLHDLFINIEVMTPEEYKNNGKSLCINYSFSESQFGDLLVASTDKGICHLSFVSDSKQGLNKLKASYANAQYRNIQDENQLTAIKILMQDWSKLNEIKLHLRGTDFQFKVWKALLSIPLGQLASYAEIANIIKHPNASRAVGTAIGRNLVAYLVPCHRVIQSNGKIGNYMWGESRKSAIIAWEAVQLETSHLNIR